MCLGPIWASYAIKVQPRSGPAELLFEFLPFHGILQFQDAQGTLELMPIALSQGPVIKSPSQEGSLITVASQDCISFVESMRLNLQDHADMPTWGSNRR